MLRRLADEQTNTSLLPTPPFLTVCSSRSEKIKKKDGQKKKVEEKKNKAEKKNVDAAVSVGDAASRRLPVTGTTVLSDTLKITVN